ncbi:MAG: DNA-processing protein DprA [Acidimicrobiales bacterium]|nr:DNA-processing protein DprA [Acidimicrobiales bacterium]
MSQVELPDEAWLAVLAELPQMGPRRLAMVVAESPPAEAWERVVARRVPPAVDAPPKVRSDWADAARSIDVVERWQRYLDLGVGVLSVDAAAYPPVLRADPYRPAVLFVRGDPRILELPCVAVVGTRRCTRYGRDLAYDLGERLSRAGVVVVSGLAVGIDAHAHRGALDTGATPVAGVVGSGLDVVYPPANRQLWSDVAEGGALVSEVPLGGEPTRWRFPARNRIIAALAAATIVVESHERGGSLLTAAEAAERGRTVIAVPGPVHSSASRGANALVAEGAQVLLHPDELGVLLPMLGVTLEREPHGLRHAISPPSDHAVAVLDALGWCPLTFDQLTARLPGPITELASTVEVLLAAGLLGVRGPWLERTLSSAASSEGRGR